MTGLLVSVRNVDEALSALAEQVDIIDVKEPRQGSLGPAAAATCHAVAAAVAGRRALSLALGELRSDDPAARLTDLPDGVFVKIGLAGCGPQPDWLPRWQSCLEQLPAGTKPVAVAYADWQLAQAPSPAEVLAHARRLQCQAFLVDTYQKTGRDLWAHLPVDTLRRLVQDAHHEGLQVVLAGSLRQEQLAAALACQPDFVAVRGAVCRGGRNGPLDRQLVRQFRDELLAITHGR